MNEVKLQKGRERSVLRRHPWIFSGAIQGGGLETGLASACRRDGDGTGLGEVVAVKSAKGEMLGYGWLSPASQIRVRMLSFDAKAVPDEAFLRARLAQAIDARRYDFVGAEARRLVNAENDGLPGVVADAYAGFVVLQLTSAFGAANRELIVAALVAAGAKGVSERSDVEVRAKEGLPVGGFAHLAGEEPPETITIEENGVKFLIDVRKGHKTGYYLDQREARRLVGAYATGEVLNCFSYTGGFGLYAAKGGARSVLQVDVSSEALRRAEENRVLNNIPDGVIATEEADVFKFLRTCRDAGRQFDTIILDPPKFAESKAQVMKAARGYKDINLLAMKLLRPGGILATFSCSSAMTSDLFDKVVAEAAADAKRDCQILARTLQADDHPVSMHFPEGQYLKGLILRAK